MIELGVPGGRCGCRSTDAALALAKQAAHYCGYVCAGLSYMKVFYTVTIHNRR